MEITPLAGPPKGYGGLSRSDHVVKTAGCPLRNLVWYAYEVSYRRVEISKHFEGGYYAVEGWVPSSRPELLKPLLRQALEAAVGYSARWEERPVDVLVVTGLPGKLGKWKGEMVGDCTISNVSCQGQPLEVLMDVIDTFGKKEVVRENLPAGLFSWSLEFDHKKPEALEEALPDQLGLGVKVERRVLPFLIVDSGKKP